jgi:hypothetical protein
MWMDVKSKCLVVGEGTRPDLPIVHDQVAPPAGEEKRRIFKSRVQKVNAAAKT